MKDKIDPTQGFVAENTPFHSEKDFIVVHSNNVERIETAINNYFIAPYLNHDELDLELFEQPDEKTLIVFPNKIESELFLFFFASIATDNELRKVGYVGWFTPDTRLIESIQSSSPAGTMTKNEPLNRMMLSSKMTREYLVGHSSFGQQVHFYYNGKIELHESNAFVEYQLDNAPLKLIKTIHIQHRATAFKDYSANRRIIKITLGSVFLLFLLLYLLSR